MFRRRNAKPEKRPSDGMSDHDMLRLVVDHLVGTPGSAGLIVRVDRLEKRAAMYDWAVVTAAAALIYGLSGKVQTLLGI